MKSLFASVPFAACLVLAGPAFAQTAELPAPATAESTAVSAPPARSEAAPPVPKKKPWYDRISLRGYTQVRHNQVGMSNEKLVNNQGDKTIGGKNGLFIRRARIVLSGDVSERVSVYLQPDFASAIGDQLNVSILRDWYADVYFDEAKTLRARFGQSKVPFGFENLQSSSSRLALDRADGLNSAIKDERDLGVSMFWTPVVAKKRFKELLDAGLKGSGDYGVVALSAYNGQTANSPERNRTPHVVGRVAWPFLFGTQFVEVAAGGYYGEFVPKRDKVGGAYAVMDARAHASLVIYPQPLGFQAEYAVGKGPELRNGAIESVPLHGGYVQTMYRMGGVTPFIKAQLYDGARKHETNAPPYEVKELEVGVEWQINPALELTGQFTASERSSPVAPYKKESGQFGRLQLQFNY